MITRAVALTLCLLHFFLLPLSAEEEKKKAPSLRQQFEDAIVDILDASSDDRDEAEKTSLRRYIDELKRELDLDPESIARITKAGDKAIAATTDDWKKSSLESFRTEFDNAVRDGEIEPGALEELLLELDVMSPEDKKEFLTHFGTGGDPTQNTTWKKALDDALTPEQKVKLEAIAAKEEEAREEQFAELIETQADNYRQHFEQQINPLAEGIITSLNLKKEREGKIEKAAEEAVEESLKLWTKRAEEHLVDMTDEQREQMLMRGYFSIGWEDKNLPHKLDVWENALDEILSSEEKSSWKENMEKRKERIQASATSFLVTALDDILWFSPDQRKRLSPLLTKPAESYIVRQLSQPNSHFSLNYQNALSYLDQAEDAKVNKILKPWQKELLKKRKDTQNQQAQIRRELQAKAKKEDKDKEDTPQLSPAQATRYVETEISKEIHRRFSGQREAALTPLLATIESATEIAKLEEDQRKFLLTMAKGAVKESLSENDGNYASWIRRSTQGSTPETIGAQLAGLGNASFGGNSLPAESDLWKHAVDHVFKDEQTEIWENAQTERIAYHDQSLLEVCIQILDTAVRLTPEQFEKVQPLLQEVLTKYRPDLESTFSRNNDTRWYLASHQLVVLFGGIPRDTLKELLTEPQREAFETHLGQRIDNYWDNVERYHKERMKKEKEAK